MLILCTNKNLAGSRSRRAESQQVGSTSGTAAAAPPAAAKSVGRYMGKK